MSAETGLYASKLPFHFKSSYTAEAHREETRLASTARTVRISGLKFGFLSEQVT